MADLFAKIENMGPIGQYNKQVHGYFTFPKLEGEISNRIVQQMRMQQPNLAWHTLWEQE